LLNFYTNYIRNSNNFQTFPSFGGVQKKILYQLIRIDEKKVGKGFIVINNYINQTVISNFASVTRETVSKEIKK